VELLLRQTIKTRWSLFAPPLLERPVIAPARAPHYIAYCSLTNAAGPEPTVLLSRLQSLVLADGQNRLDVRDCGEDHEAHAADREGHRGDLGYASARFPCLSGGMLVGGQLQAYHKYEVQAK